jgi:hypothetical protein
VTSAAASVHRSGESRVLALLPNAERERILGRCEQELEEQCYDVVRREFERLLG